MEYRDLGRTGLRVSVLGLGASPLGNVYGRVSDREAERLVRRAVEAGVTLVDTSPFYGAGLSEERLGRALKGCRYRVVLATKAGRYFEGGTSVFDCSPARLRRSVEESLRRLRTDAVDVLFLHDAEFVPEERVLGEALPVLHALKREGKARAVGVTGRPPGVLARLAERGEVDAVLSYSCHNLLDRSLETGLAPLCRARGLGLLNAGVLDMGLLAPGGPPAWHPADAASRAAAARVRRFCEAHGRSLEAEALRFALAYAVADSTLLGVRSVRELEADLRALENPPDADFLAALRSAAAPPDDPPEPPGCPSPGPARPASAG